MTNSSVEDQEKKFNNYFINEIRKHLENIEKEKILEYLEELYHQYKDQVFHNCDSLKSHKFYSLIENHFYSNNSIETPNCDDMLLTFIRDVSKKTNKPYFQFIFKFILLFREFYNQAKRKSESKDEEYEYTQFNNAENLPDFCNDFIVEYMEPYDYFGLDTGELIEIIQYFCFWMYSNGYTSSRLTLL